MSLSMLESGQAEPAREWFHMWVCSSLGCFHKWGFSGAGVGGLDHEMDVALDRVVGFMVL